jgi:magnesium-protoporphyrin IX monomethyl ester (oxidative) cyclase
VYPIGFVRFSRYFEDPDAFGLKLRPQDFYRLTFPFEDEAVANLAYHFVDEHADTENMDRWLDTLNKQVAAWRERWMGKDGRPQARLCFLEDEPTVYDSRSGEEREYSLTEQTKRVLDLLVQPTTALQVTNAFADVSGFDAQREIAFLQERDLLFEENGRYLSLVVE